MPARNHPTIHVRLSPDGLRKLQALAESRGVNRSRCIRQLLDEATVSGHPRRRLSEEKLLDLMNERARDGNVSAIRALLEIERQKDPRQGALDALERMAESRRQ